MTRKKSKLLLTLDEVLDADELDVITAEIEHDMEADEDEEDDEEEMEGRSEDSDDEEDPNTSTTIYEAGSSTLPPAITIPEKRKRKTRSNTLVSGKSYSSIQLFVILIRFCPVQKPPSLPRRSRTFFPLLATPKPKNLPQNTSHMVVVSNYCPQNHGIACKPNSSSKLTVLSTQGASSTPTILFRLPLFMLCPNLFLLTLNLIILSWLNKPQRARTSRQ
jgi:hypothetical protein